MQIYKALTILPVLHIELSICGWWDDGGEGKKVIKTDDRASPLVVHSNQEYTLCIKLTRLNKEVEKRAYAPRFPKPKDDGWFLTLGHIENMELLALKRVPPVHHKSNQQLLFSTPSKSGKQSE